VFRTWIRIQNLELRIRIGKKFRILTNPDPQHCSVLIFKKNCLKNGPHSDPFRSDIIRVRTYFAFGGRDIRTKIVRTKVSFGHVLFGDRSFGDRSFGDLTVYRFFDRIRIRLLKTFFSKLFCPKYALKSIFTNPKVRQQRFLKHLWLVHTQKNLI
jgi:hypothetical protein